MNYPSGCSFMQIKTFNRNFSLQNDQVINNQRIM